MLKLLLSQSSSVALGRVVRGSPGLRQQVSMGPLVPVVSGLPHTVHGKYNTRLNMDPFSFETYTCPDRPPLTPPESFHEEERI